MKIDRSANMMNGDLVRVQGASCIIATLLIQSVYLQNFLSRRKNYSLLSPLSTNQNI